MTSSQLLLTVALSVGISVPSTLLVNRYVAPPKQIASVNLKQLTREYIARLEQESISEDDIAHKTQQFEHQLKRQLLSYIYTHNAVVLVGPAVIDGARDITPDLRRRMALTPLSQT